MIKLSLLDLQNLKSLNNLQLDGAVKF